MKTVLLSGLALLATGHIASAQVLASDDFSYVGALTANGWAAHSGAGNKQILSDGSVATLDQSGGSGEDVNLPFPPQGATDTTYASFTLNVPSGNPVNPDASGLYCVHLWSPTFAYRARTGLLSPAGSGDFVLAINADNSNLGAGASWATDLSFDTDYQVVVSWDAATGESKLWLDPVDMSSTSIAHTGAGMGDLMEGIALRQSNDYTGFITIDNVIAGKTFDDVTGGSGPGTPYCFGNVASGNPCPCGNDNDGTLPLGGCEHDDSTAGAVLTATGTASVSNDTLLFQGSRGPISNSTLFFQANNNLDGGGVFLGDGIRCAGGGLVRLKVATTDANGDADSAPLVVTVRSASFGHPISPGETLYYQWWIRDSGGSPCGNESNTSNGYEITWLP